MQKTLMSHRPATIMLELYPDLMTANGYPGGVQGMLAWLEKLGYTQILHIG